MKSTPLILLFLSILLPINTTSASEVDEWLDNVFQYDMVATRFVIKYDPEYKKNIDQIYSNAEFSLVAKEKVPLRSTVKFNGDKILLNDKPLKFKKLDTEQFQNNGCVLKLSFNLDSAKPITIWEHETKHYNYQAIYLNGQALERTRFDTWSLPTSGRMSTPGKAGKNTIIAVTSRSHTKAKPQVLHILTEAPSLRAKEVGQSLIKIGDEKSKDVIGNALTLLSYYGWLVDGKTLADGLFYYIQSFPSKSNEKDEGKRRWDIGYFARSISDRLADEARNVFVKQIRQRAPRWIYNGMYSHGGRIQWRTIHAQVESVARLGDDQDVSDFISFIIATVKPWIKTKKDEAQIRDAYLHYITYTLRFNSLFATSLELAEKLEDLPGVSRRDWRRRTIGEAEQRMAAKAQLAGNPEAQQYHSEFKLLLQRGADDDRAVDSMVTLFRRAGQKMMVSGLGMRNLGAEMLYELESDKKFHEKVIARAADQFNSRVNMALQRGNLDEMGELIQVYGLLVRTDAIHKSLMNEYLDRCRFDRARYHALRLVESNDKETQVDAYSKILLIEDILKMSSGERTPIPSRLFKENLEIAGQTKTLGDIHEFFNGITKRQQGKTSGPGSLVCSQTLGIPNFIHNSGHGEFLDNIPYAKQCVAPLSLNDKVYISSPTYIHAIDVNKKELAWHINQDVAAQPYTSGLSSVSYPATIVNGNIVRLWSTAQGRSLTISAFDTDGRVVWDFYDHQQNLKYAPVCTPHSAFGLLFTVVYDRTVRDQIQFALVQLNTSDGAIDKIIPLNTMFRDFPVEKARHGQHFFSDEEHLYGISGSGTVFKVNRKNLQLEWVAGQILRSMRHSVNPPAFIRPYGNAVVAFMPNLQEWVAVSSRSGRRLWRWKNAHHCYIHSRNSSDALIISDEFNTLYRINPDTGSVIWRSNGNSLPFTGEGCILESKVYVPCENGYAIYNIKDGLFESFTKTPYTPNKISRDQNYWYFLSKTDIHIHTYGSDYSHNNIKLSDAVFDDAPISNKQQKPHQLIFDDIHPAKTLTAPITLDEHTRMLKTGVPHYYVIDRNREQGIALFREAHTDANGTPVSDSVIWMDSKKHYRIYGDKLVFWNNNDFRIEQIPNREIIFSGNIKRDYKMSQICEITVTNDRCLVFGGRNYESLSQILIIDLKTGREISGQYISKEVGLAYASSDIYILYDNSQQNTICYDTQSGKELWQYKDKDKRRVARKVSDNVLMVGYKDHFAFLEEKTGKVLYKKFKCHINGVTFANDHMLWSKGALNLKTKKRIKDVYKVAIDERVGGAVFAKNQPVTWHDNLGSIELQMPYGHAAGFLYSDRYGARATLIDGVIHLFSHTSYASFDRKTGSLIAQERLTNDDKTQILEVMHNSVILRHSNKLITLRPGPNLDFTVPFCYGYDVAENGWPTEGWLKPQRIEDRFWLSQTNNKPRHKYAYQIGRDEDHVYVRLIASAPRTPNDNRQFEMTLEYVGQYEKNFKIDWNIDRSTNAVTDISRAPRLKSWKQVDSRGNLHCFMIFNRDDIKLDWHVGYAPRIHIEITEYTNGGYNGRYMLGGPAFKGSKKVIGLQAGNQIAYYNHGNNYLFREEVFSKSEDFYPQGHTLARWIQTRRFIHGHEGNITFLSEMLKRCSKSGAAPNILAVLFYEYIDKWEVENPDKLMLDEEFKIYRKSILDKLKAQALSSGLSKEATEYGLSFFSVEFFPYYNTNYAIRGMHITGNRKDRHGFGINTKNDSLFIKRQDRPFVIHFLVGLYHTRAPKFIDSLNFSDPHGFYGEFAFHTPDKTTLYMDRKGKYHNGLKPPPDSRNNSGNERSTRYAYRGTTYTPKDFRRGGRGFGFGFPTIELPEIAAKKFNSEDLLLMLENLPSDSDIGLNLAWEYFKVTPEDKRKSGDEIFNIILRQISPNKSNRYIPEVIKHLFNHYRSMKLPPNQVYQKLKDDLDKHRIDRNLQRRMFTKFNNNMRGSGRWYNLGVFKKEKDLNLTPLPENLSIEDLFTTDFTYGKKKYKFKSSDSKTSQSRTSSRFRIDNNSERDHTFAYHYMKFDLLEKKKLWFFIKQENPNRYGSNIKIWIDSELVFDGRLEHGQYTPAAIPFRLNKGEHHILIRYDFLRGWDLEFAIGDSYGLPLEIVDLPRLIPSK